ncbi:NAD-dependent epimerase/dehydratase family protein [Microbulbifer bruguierae]|uniref:NAD-dependent epimerase/dehydratase family protein n=1 Tax=Microbulbifer bruguierae TaxID=3029061 RepID=A0ABY8NGZ6_9GAMM|nr:NAD-dependent epimerase/dehydratase family protein [Microbulbifer bruguierae]WGL17634.1 NAD-dependent epimerase/dehydratase family protein [Microbulbifer bruguierae]
MSTLNTAFVTGAGGFIGRHLVHQLLTENVRVVALMMPGERVPEEWAAWGDQLRSVIGDVRTLTGLADEIGPVDAIFHLAAVVGDWGALQSHVDITVHGTEQAIELAQRWGSHFIVTTSVCAYASALAKGKLNEESPVGKPCSPYEFCKQEQERVTLEAVKHGGLKATIVRPGNVFGVGSGPWVNTMLELLRSGQPCLLGKGDWDAGLVHVKNLVAMLIAAARSDADGEIFVASDGYGVTWQQYLQRLASLAGTPAPKSVPNFLARGLAPVLEFIGHLLRQEQRPMITRQSFRLMGGPNEFSNEKARRLLGYEPVVTFDQAMNELQSHFQSSATAAATA